MKSIQTMIHGFAHFFALCGCGGMVKRVRNKSFIHTMSYNFGVNWYNTPIKLNRQDDDGHMYNMHHLTPAQKEEIKLWHLEIERGEAVLQNKNTWDLDEKIREQRAIYTRTVGGMLSVPKEDAIDVLTSDEPMTLPAPGTYQPPPFHS